MARTHARIKTAIWSDRDFRGLSSGAQRLYHLVVEQPELSLCGVIAVTLGRWADMAPDTTVRTLKRFLDELAGAAFVVLDQRTEEVWIRTFAKHDIQFGSPNVVISMAKDWVGIQSQCIRQRFLEGLPEGLLEGFPEPYRDKLPKPFVDGFLTCVPAHLHPPTSILQPPIERKRSRTIPDDFVLTEEMRQWCIDGKVVSDPEQEFAKFCDYWRGNGKTKLDWVATWRNWMRNADTYASQRGGVRAPAMVRRQLRACVDCGKSLDRQPIVNTQQGPKCQECAA